MAGNLRKIDDIELVRRVKENGDQLAYGALLDKYQKSISFTILKIVNNRDDAEDLTMLTFTKAFHNIENYNTEYAFTTWLFKIASNAAIDFIRKRRLETTSLDKQMGNDENGSTFASNIIDDALDPEESMVREQRNKIMQTMIDKLTPMYRDLIRLRFFEELKYDEIAQRTNVPIGTVKIRISRAKKMLADILHKNKEDY
ncbi:MAG: RNA polymerase sigma factor [Chitinophagales bacterium]